MNEVPDPARAPGPRPRFWRRFVAWSAAGVGVTIAALALWTFLSPEPSMEADIGPVVRVQRMRPWIEGVPLERRVREADSIRQPPDALWLSVPGAPQKAGIGDPDGGVKPQIVAKCGCVYTPYEMVFRDDAVIYVFRGWPRNETSLRITRGQDALDLELTPSVAPAPPPPAPAREITPYPWSGTVGNARVTLTYATDEDGKATWRPAIRVEQVQEYVGAPRQRFRDALGNTYEHHGWMTEYAMPLPFGSCLCPHSAWWEMELRQPGQEPMTLRFAPPK